METTVNKTNKNGIGRMTETPEKDTVGEIHEGKEFTQDIGKAPADNEQVNQTRMGEEELQEPIKITDSGMGDSEAEKETSASHIESKESTTISDVEIISKGNITKQVKEPPTTMDPGERSTSKENQIGKE